jgi:cysteinyl-tRNA synthetase
MWPFSRKQKVRTNSAPILFTNTLSGRKEPFSPQKQGVATLYSCGPTVYSPQHIGNMRGAVFADLTGRVLKASGYRVRRVINITDVGHLLGDNEGDASQGEDRIEKSAREQGVTAGEITRKYTELYFKDLRDLNIDLQDILFPRATEYIKEQIAMIQKLEDNGLTYRISDGLYFDTNKFPEYGALGGIKEFIKNGSAASLEDRVSLAGHSRIKKNDEKRSPADFALWKFSVHGDRRQQEWSSPWGRGFPGWHIECSAMSKALLGDTIDVHTGGIEHIPTHHNGEIAQSEGVSGKQFVRYWLHQAHLNLGGEKISKSEGRVFFLSEIIERGYHPLALRYFFLQAHYRSPLSFSWEALAAANEALHRLWRIATEIKDETKGVGVPSDNADRITNLLRDDLGTPAALAYLWETVRDDALPSKAVWGAIEAADSVLGLSLMNPPAPAGAISLTDLPEDVRKLVGEREAARQSRQFSKADELRIHIQKRGYHVDDSPTGPAITKI